ncbi:MAG: oligosaccharide flippase family protein [Sphingomonadales bacterium]|nr:oligosaccharide flippase family protein [Sphingomonadales bacterium]
MVGTTLSDKVAKGALLLSAMRFAARALDLVTLAVLTRILFPADFGIVALALSVMQVTEAALEISVGLALMQFRAVARTHLDTAFTLALIRGVLVTVVLAIAAFPIATFYGDHRLVALIAAMGIAPALRGLRSPKVILLARGLRFGQDGASEFIGKLAALVVSVGLAVTTGSYWAIAAGTIANPLANAIATYVLVPYRPRLTLRSWRLFHRFMGWAFAGQTVNALNWQTDRFVLGKFASAAMLGLFSTAREFAAIAYKVLFDTMQRPIYSALALASTNQERLCGAYAKVLAAVLSIGLPIACGQALVAPELVRLLLGERWLGGIPVFQVVSLTLIPGFYSSLTSNLFLAVGKPELVFRRNLQDFCVRVPVAIWLIWRFGLYGALGALVIADVVLALICMKSAVGVVGLSMFDQVRIAWRGWISTAVMVLAVWLLRLVVPPATTFAGALEALAIIVPVAAAVYAGAHLLAWRLSGRPIGIEDTALRLLGQWVGWNRASRPAGLAR